MTDTIMRMGFETDGFIVVRDVATGPALDQLRQVAGRLEDKARSLARSTDDFVLEAEGAGGWVAWQQGNTALAGVLRSVSNAHSHEPDLLRIADDIRLADSILAVTGYSRISIVNVFLWAKPQRVGSAKPWHQDMAFAPPGFTKEHDNVITVWLALDPATRANGCLEFVAGSHQLGLLPHDGDTERTQDQPRAEQAVEPHVDLGHVLPQAQPVPVTLDPGSAVMFDGMILHRSAANTADSPRRAISYVYAITKEG